MRKAARIQTEQDAICYLENLRLDLLRLLGENVPHVPLNPRSRGMGEAHGLRFEKLVLDTEPRVTVPAWLFLPPQLTGKAPSVVMAHPLGKQGLVETRAALLRDVLDQGVAVLAMDTRMRGELRRNWRWNHVIWGRPEAGMAAHDLISGGRYLRSRPEVDSERLFVAGFGAAGLFALHAGALDSQWRGVAIEDVGPFYGEEKDAPELPHVLQSGDVPDFAALISPRPIWLNGAKSRFDLTAKVYGTLGGQGHIRTTDFDAQSFDKALPDWLRQATNAR
jgi:hypothetical protein